jgi:starch synthase
MRIVNIASEFASLSKTGGLADVVSALSRALAARGHDVRVFLPAYGSLDALPLDRWEVEVARDVELVLGSHHYRYTLQQAVVPGTAFKVYLINCPALFHRPALYGEDADEHRRFLLLTRAALDSCQRLGFAPDIVHCHDWHAAFAPLLLKTTYAWDRLFAATRTVFTIHNLGYQGIFSADHADDLGLGAGVSQLQQSDLYAGRINALLHGVVHADVVTTVSPTYAREICTPEHGFGVDPFLRARGTDLVGILNGVDYAEWDPRHDAYVTERFNSEDLSGKARAKAALLHRMELAPTDRAPLLGIVSRLTWQKGLDLLYEVLPALLAKRDLRLVGTGNGDPALENFFVHLQRRFSKQVVFHRGYNEELAHWIEAAADGFIMPSRYEPCGLNQMYSLRYGTLPIVRRTGGLADSVQHYEAATGEGTGVVFEHADAPGLRWALEHFLWLYSEPAQFQRAQQNAMAQNFSWDHQASLYEALFARHTSR